MRRVLAAAGAWVGKWCGQWPGVASLVGLAAWAALPVASASAQPVRTEHVTAELVAREAGVAPGGSLSIGLRLQHIPHWHTYWRNPGDSGLPTTIAWTLPAGAQAGPIEWPAPRRLPVGPLVNFGYEGDLLLPLRFTAPADARPGQTLALKAEASWLACREVCVPESATLQLAIAVLPPGESAAPGPLAARFDAAEAQRPKPLSGWRIQGEQAGGELQLRLQPPAGPGGTAPGAWPALQFFPYPEQVLAAAPHALYRTADAYLLRLALAPNMSAPAELPGVLVAEGDGPPPWGGSSRQAEVTVALRNVAALALPADAVAMDSAAAPSSAPGGDAAALSGSLLLSIALALVGGLLLNAMPCVFPVLSIKLLGLAQHAHEPAQRRWHAAGYTLGVVLSFLALAGLLLALRAAGSAVGWGFQLQSPGLVYALALLFFALGLNLFGAFELSALVPRRLADWRSSRPAVDAFGGGVLAVLAASPCTAPFMGAALGAALAMRAPEALAVFAALGLGMALPYAALALVPGWQHRLPRPGPWMLRLKQALAFPMWATVIWLLWVLGQQTGLDAVARALLGLLVLAAGIWALGQWPAGGRAGVRNAAGWALGASTAALLAWTWPAGEAAPDTLAQAAPTPSTATASTPAPFPARWLPYSDAALKAQVQAGRPVFVDFTAAWCVSCQVNKRLVLEREPVLRAFAEAGVVLMRADWTRRDAEISAALQRLGRYGVPVYLLQAPGRPPELLPEILTTDRVQDALARLRAP